MNLNYTSTIKELKKIQNSFNELTGMSQSDILNRYAILTVLIQFFEECKQEAIKMRDIHIGGAAGILRVLLNNKE